MIAIWGPLMWRMSVADAFVQPRRPPRRLCRAPTARPDGDESWAAKNPEVLAFVCGGLFGLVPSASTFLAAPPDELHEPCRSSRRRRSGPAQALPGVHPYWARDSGALAEFTTIRVLTASTVSFGLVSQASGRVVGELGTGWHITI